MSLRGFLWLIGALIAGLVGMIMSVSIGSMTEIGLGDVAAAVFSYDGSLNHLIVRELRLPRAVLAGIVGASLALAGALMQGVTGNPLASPGLLGINAGAALGFVAAVTLFPELGAPAHVSMAFVGAAVGGAAVFKMGSGHGSVEPARLVLAGIAVTALLASFTQGLILFNENSTEEVVYWLVGGVDGRDWGDVKVILPWWVVGFLGALLLAKPLDVIAFGDEMAANLGENTSRVRLFGSLGVVVLAGASVAVAGPIAFIGLIVPHIARRTVGVRHLLLLPTSAALGGALLIFADIAARFIAFPYEAPAGIVTALIGAPFFLFLSRRQKDGL